jgi:hypothetical protein
MLLRSSSSVSTDRERVSQAKTEKQMRRSLK